jgi:hypothetical protein
VFIAVLGLPLATLAMVARDVQRAAVAVKDRPQAPTRQGRWIAAGG